VNQFFCRGEGYDIVPHDAGAPLLVALRALEDGD
jgi:hypothetical protein